MAKMLPNFCPKDAPSTEKRIYSLLEKDKNTKNWKVLHHLQLKSGIRRLCGEIDFLVLAPDYGVFVIEVKGKIFVDKNKTWQRWNGNDWEPCKSPFAQAESAIHSVRKFIFEKIGVKAHFRNMLFSYGVITRLSAIPQLGIDIDGWRVWDKSKNDEPINKLIKQLAKKEELIQKEKYNRKTVRPDNQDIDYLIELLRPSFDSPTKFYEPAQDIEWELYEFTKDQFEVLDTFSENDRVLIEGAAGTGKTFLACETAKRALQSGKRVLVTYYTKRLRDQILHFMGRDCEKEENLLRVDHFHSILNRILLKQNNRYRDPDTSLNPNWFSHDLPKLVVDALSNMTKNISLFDYIVIDEGQDLITAPYLKVIDKLINGGLFNGKWHIFADFEHQAIFSNNSSKTMIELLGNIAYFARCKLTTNCRNTREIANNFSAFSGFKTPKKFVSIISGHGVNIKYYSDEDEHNRILDEEIRKYFKENRTPTDIAVLSPYTYENSKVSNLISMGDNYTIVNEKKKTPIGKTAKLNIPFYTIHSFKGLEKGYIIVTDIEELGSEWAKKVLYTGMSRAKIGLTLLMHTRYKKYVPKLRKNKIKPEDVYEKEHLFDNLEDAFRAAGIEY